MNIVLSFFELVPVTFAQSLYFSFVALAIAIPFRFVAFSDISSEGSLLIGGAVCGRLLLIGLHPLIATLCAFVVGCGVGTFTGAIHLKFRIHSLLCGILTVTMLYSITLRILGKPNISIMELPNLFSYFGISDQDLLRMTLFVIGLLITIILLLHLLLKSQLGLRFRAIGLNPKLATTQGINLFTYTLFGLAIANGLSGFAGALLVQSQGYVDVGMGFGVLINGLAGLMLGEFLLYPKTLLRQILAPVLGTVIFSQLSSFTLCLGFEPSDLKFITGLFLLVILTLPNLRSEAKLA